MEWKMEILPKGPLETKVSTDKPSFDNARAFAPVVTNSTRWKKVMLSFTNLIMDGYVFVHTTAKKKMNKHK